MGGNRSAVSNAQLDAIREQLQQNNNGAVPQNFVRTASGHDSSSPNPRGRMPRSNSRNPQTEQFLDMLGLPFNLDQRQPRPTAVASQGVTAVSVAAKHYWANSGRLDLCRGCKSMSVNEPHMSCTLHRSKPPGCMSLLNVICVLAVMYNIYHGSSWDINHSLLLSF